MDIPLGLRKFSDTTGYRREYLLRRRKSEFEYGRKFSLDSHGRGGRLSQYNIMEGVPYKRPSLQLKDRVKPIDEIRPLETIFTLSLGKAKLMKTKSSYNLGFNSFKKPQKNLGNSKTERTTIGRFLRRIRSENNVIPPSFKNRILPLVRFRRAVKTVQVLLKATLSNNTQGQRNESKLLSWAHDDISSSKREYEMFGLSFDPGDFRAKKEAQLSNEAKAILSMDPGERNEEQLKVALLALNQAVESFSEFPITMQRSLVRAGWYEHFEDKRVIIRQGHMADNFYFILSGTAVVTILQTDTESGEEVARTAAVLKKGNSFGELALMHGAKRSATVTCKNSVELLAVGREDFVDIFMPMDKDQEPEHIRFLRTIHLLNGWPLQRLPYHDPKVCCFTYFRRGLLLCKDSNTSDWIYVIKTGTCRVLKALHAAKPNVPGLTLNHKKAKELLKLPPISSDKSSSSVTSLSPTSSIEFSPRSNGTVQSNKRRCTTDSLANILHKPYPDDQSIREFHQRQIDQIFNQKHTHNTKWGKRLSTKTQQPQLESAAKRHKSDTVYVQIQKLGPKETYGVEQAAFGRIGKTTSTILVSEGAECILINKKYFQQYLTDEEAKRIRRTLQPIPSDESLQQKLQDMTNWEAFKAVTVVNQMFHQKRLLNGDSLYY